MNFTLKRLWYKEEGVAMLEFALVAPVLFLLLFAALEYGIINFVSGTLHNVVNEAGRLGMTGGNYTDLQDPATPPMTREEFLVFYIHERLGPIAEMGEITINPIPYQTLSGMNAGGGIPGGYGSGGQIVIYEVEFQWKILTPLLGEVIGEKGYYIIHARTVIQNEEFS